MRKIEQEMLNAVRSIRSWQGGNTTVFTAGGIITVCLHGNRIATSAGTDTGYSGSPTMKPDLDTFRKWPSRTTCSRLRALGIAASLKNGLPCIDGEAI